MRLEEHGRRLSDGDGRSRTHSFIVPGGEGGGAGDVRDALGAAGGLGASGLVPSVVVTPSSSRSHDEDEQTESDENENILQKPTSPKPGSEQCPLEEHHEGRELLSVCVPLPVDRVFSLLFHLPHLMTDVYAAKKTIDVTFGVWQDRDGEASTRQVTYNMALPLSTLGAKASFVTEKQTLQASQPGHLYVVETDAVNSGIPYADAFSVFNHYCITRETPTRTSLVVHTSIKYKKQLWGFVKSMIEKNAYSGVEGVMTEIGQKLTEEADKLNQSHSRRKGRLSSSASDTQKQKHLDRQTSTRGNEIGGGGVSAWVAALVLALVVVLALGNWYLLAKLWKLEENSLPYGETLVIDPIHLPTSWEGVARILQRQDNIHENQLNQWKQTLQDASLQLNEIQRSLEEVLESIPKHVQTMAEQIFLEASLSQGSVEGDTVDEAG